MESYSSTESPSLAERLGMAFRLLFNGTFAGQVAAGLRTLAAKETKPAPAPARAPEVSADQAQASGLFVLAALQREGRWIDFLQQDIAGFSDEEVGAAARVVHAGCSKVLKQYFELEPSMQAEEESRVTIAKGFDARRIRLTGNITGQPPFQGILKHHGWVAKSVRLPSTAEGLDPKVIAPAEVELP